MNHIINFQQSNGLVPDGNIGRLTMTKMIDVWGLNKFQISHFLGQVSHETGGFELAVENLNYSASGLLKVFSKYFRTQSKAMEYARRPEKIANFVYSNRMGNGNEASGDGYKFRGRGALQTTGHDNYLVLSKYIKDDSIMNNPDLVASKYYWESALFYFNRNNLWALSGKDVSENTIKAVTKAINGGYNGLSDRIEKTLYYYNKIK